MLTLKPFAVTNEIRNLGNSKHLSKAELRSTKFGLVLKEKVQRKC